MKKCFTTEGPRFKWALAVVLLLSLFVFGCVDLKAIRGFSEISSESVTYTSFTDDYVKSVERLKRYESKTRQEDLDKTIAAREAQIPALLAMHKEVAAYMGGVYLPDIGHTF